MSKIFLKNAEIVVEERILQGGLLIENGKIVKITEQGVKIDGAKEIDCEGKIILPGLIDVHVHFREPGQAYKEDWETGSKAAAAGGVTTVCDMPNNKPPIVTLADLEAKRKLIEGRSYVNYGLYMGYNGQNADEINRAKNIAGVKIYCAHSTGNMGVEKKHLENAFKEIDGVKPLLFHSEDETCIEENQKRILANYREDDVDPWVHSQIRSPECALMMTKYICSLAKKYQRPIHICHVSTEAELELIDKHRQFGVTCEVAPHHLTLSEDDYEYMGNMVKMNPPLRARMDVFGLWKCLKAGMVDIIATDHAPHTLAEKDAPYLQAPSGVPGVEMMLPILLNTVNNDGITIQEVVQMCSYRPAEIFKMKGKGRIAEGYDADLVVVDMEIEKKLENEDVWSKCGWSPYAESVFKGWPVMTFVGGEIVFDSGKIIGNPLGNGVHFD